MEDLLALSNNLAAAVERGARTVFGVDARPRLGSTGVHWRAGLVVTANHTVQTDGEVIVTRPDGRAAKAVIAGRDPAVDLAVLRVETADVPVAEIGDSDAVRVGHIVLALGQGPRASWGIVSALGARGEPRPGSGPWSLDLTLYPGFSGGPLVDALGRVVGVTTSGGSRASRLAIPAATVQRVVDELVRRGHLPRAYLGLGSQYVRLPDTVRERLHLEQDSAVIVVDVRPDSPAAAAGLLIGDIVLSLAGTQITEPSDLRAVLRPERVGREEVASIVRGGEAREIRITIGERPARSRP